MSDRSNIVIYVAQEHGPRVEELLGKPNLDLSQGNAWGGFWEDMPWGAIDDIETLTKEGIPHLYWTSDGSYGAWHAYDRVFDGKNVDESTEERTISMEDREMTLDELRPKLIQHNNFIRAWNKMKEELGIEDFFKE